MTLVLLISVLVAGDPAGADNWTSFRNGGKSRSHAENLPLQWSPNQGIAWQRELVGYGQSAPVVWKDTVFVTSVVGPMKEKCVVAALDARSGNVAWEKEFEACAVKASNFMASRAAPTPAVDEQGVYAFFEGGNLVALSHDGKVRWERSLTNDYGPFENGHGLGSSLAQTAGVLFVLVDHKGPSYLLAVDKATGETKWKADREPRYSWTSPIVVPWKGKEQVVVSSNGFVDGYDGATGGLLWTVEGVAGNTIPSPAAAQGRIFIGAAKSERGPTAAGVTSCCLQLPNGADESECKVLWRAKKASNSYASPVPAGDFVYSVNKVGVVYCLDTATGAERYAERIDGPCWATPIVVADRAYFFGKNGVTSVLKVGPEFSRVATNALWNAKEPPKPETYTEHRQAQPEGKRTDSADRLAEADKDGDGKLTKDELPESMQGFFSRLDANSDGVLDQEELAAMRERSSRDGRGGEGRGSMGSGGRGGMGGSWGDPTVYGVAAAGGAFFIRTGTRLYCVRQPAAVAAKPAE